MLTWQLPPMTEFSLYLSKETLRLIDRRSSRTIGNGRPFRIFLLETFGIVPRFGFRIFRSLRRRVAVVDFNQADAGAVVQSRKQRGVKARR